MYPNTVTDAFKQYQDEDTDNLNSVKMFSDTDGYNKSKSIQTLLNTDTFLSNLAMNHNIFMM